MHSSVYKYSALKFKMLKCKSNASEIPVVPQQNQDSGEQILKTDNLEQVDFFAIQ